MLPLNNLIFAHRGIFDNKTIVENTIDAFKLCIKKKINIELDIHQLNDNTIVVYHDYNLKRLTGIDKSIYDYSYKVLKKLKLLNTNQHIPRLNEVLSLVKGQILINIEIKNNNNFDNLYKELDHLLTNYNGKIIIQSFFPDVVRKINKRKKYQCGLLINRKEKFVLNKLFLKHICPSFLAISKDIINDIKKSFINNYKVLVWTIEYHKIEQYKNVASSYICNIKYGVQERI